MDVHTAEAQRIEEIKKWWRENGLSVALGLVLGISGMFGWRYWQDGKVGQAEAASALYSNMIASLRDENETETRESADKILSDYGNTSYAVFALMALARLAVDGDDPDAAETHLRQALRQSADESLSHVIRLRLIRALIGLNKPEQASALANRQEKGAFAAGYAELLGDIGVMQGDAEAARNAYRQAIDKERADGRDVAVLELKLHNVGQPD